MGQVPDIVKELRQLEKKGELLPCSQPLSIEQENIENEKETQSENKDIFVTSEPKQDHKILYDLRSDQQIYKTIFENSAIAITVLDKDEKIIFWNKYVEKLLNMDEKDLYHKPIQSLYPKEEWKRIHSQNIWEKSTPHHLETKIMKKDEQTVDVDISFSVLKDKNDNITGSIGVITDISNRKYIKAKLKESEQEFKNFFLKAPVPYHVLKPDGIISAVNEKWCQKLGYNSDEIIGKSLFDFIIDKERDFARHSFEMKSKSKKFFSKSVERTFTTKDGAAHVFSVQDFYAFDEEKNLQSIHSIMFDVTDRINIEKALMESKQKYKSIIENTSDLIMVTQPDGNISYLSPSCKAVLGYDSEELLGIHLDIFHPDDSEKGQKMLSKALQGKGGTDYAYRILTKDSEIRWISHSWTPIFRDNKVHLIISVIRDFTERKKGEEALKRSQENFQNVIRHNADGIIIVDDTGEIHFVNPAAEQLFGRPAEEFVGDSFNIPMQSSDKTIELDLTKKNGTKFSAEMRIVKTEWEGTNKFLVSLRDITEKKLAREKLAEAHEMLQSINKQLERKVKARTVEVENLLKQKDEFIGQMGHDLKTPLSIILNVIPIIKADVQSEDVKKYCEVADRNVKYIRSLVTETLKIAELSSPYVKLNCETFPVWEQINDNLEKKEFLFKEKEITVIHTIDKSFSLYADKLRFEELLTNLITNSVKFTPKGGSITIDATLKNNIFTFSVTDTGIGLNADQTDKIFKEFYKVDESRHEIDSSGLGLNICKRIVEKHGGKIWAESPGLNKGTTIYFTLKEKEN